MITPATGHVEVAVNYSEDLFKLMEDDGFTR